MGSDSLGKSQPEQKLGQSFKQPSFESQDHVKVSDYLGASSSSNQNKRFMQQKVTNDDRNWMSGLGQSDNIHQASMPTFERPVTASA